MPKYFDIPKPYIVFTGSAQTANDCKTAGGAAEWTNFVAYQTSLPDGTYRIPNVPYISLEELLERGPSLGSFVHGTPTRSGVIPESHKPILEALVRRGFTVAACLHERLNDSWLKNLSSDSNQLIDFRFPDIEFGVGTGRKRTGYRLLTVGHDANCGKKYTSLTLHNRCKKLGINSTFRPTGQTGMLIVDFESGIVNDVVRADFLAGAAEYLSPDNEPDHLDIIEGQGSIFHPGFCGGSLSLLMGSQPDFIVLCIDPTRKLQRGTDYAPRSIRDEIFANELFGRRTNPNCTVVGLSVNLSKVPPEKQEELIGSYKEDFPELKVFSPNIVNSCDFLLYSIKRKIHSGWNLTGLL